MTERDAKQPADDDTSEEETSRSEDETAEGDPSGDDGSGDEGSEGDGSDDDGPDDDGPDDDGPDDDAEEASDRARSKKPAEPEKAAGKKKKDASKKAARADQPAASGTGAKKKKKKGTSAGGAKTSRAEASRPGRSDGAKGAKLAEGAVEPEENTKVLIAGAVLVAVAVVAGLYFWNNRGGPAEGALVEVESETPATAAEERSDEAEARLMEAFGDPPPRPPMPGALPAPPDVAAPPADATRTPSGLASRVIEAGTGTEHPSATDRVTVQYTGWTTDGRMFDSSRTRGAPATFGLDGVIAGWTEGVQLMVVGEQRRFWIPQDLAYQGRPGPPAGMLVFDIELVSFETPPPPPPAPPVPSDVAAAPRNAQRTESGLASRVLERGTGSAHPTPQSQVRVHYTGWTTDGEMFDSSVTRGEPITFPVGRVIPGWAEGVQLMVVGERRRLWIPENLAYGGRPGAPAGMLVFDVELLEIL